ncbi:MAG: hypothetical protein WCY11_05450 [Novosphingobium sp.]
MANVQIVGLGVRIFTIWLALYVLRHVPSLWSLNTNEFGDPKTAVIVLIVGALLVVLIVFLWIFPLTVARKLIPRAALDEPTTLPIDQIQAVGFCLLGLWLIASAVPNVFFWMVMVYQSNRPESLLSLEPRNYASMTYTVTEFSIGAWLVFGARGLLGLMRWARTAGTSEPSNPVLENGSRQEQPRAPQHKR